MTAEFDGYAYPQGIEQLMVSLYGLQWFCRLLSESEGVFNINETNLGLYSTLTEADQRHTAAIRDLAAISPSVQGRVGESNLDELYGLIVDLMPTECSVMVRQNEPNAAIRYLHQERDSIRNAYDAFSSRFDYLLGILKRTGRPTTQEERPESKTEDDISISKADIDVLLEGVIKCKSLKASMGKDFPMKTMTVRRGANLYSYLAFRNAIDVFKHKDRLYRLSKLPESPQEALEIIRNNGPVSKTKSPPTAT